MHLFMKFIQLYENAEFFFQQTYIHISELALISQNSKTNTLYSWSTIFLEKLTVGR